MKSREERAEEEKKARATKDGVLERRWKGIFVRAEGKGRIVEGSEGRRRRGDRESRLFWRGAGEIGENN